MKAFPRARGRTPRSACLMTGPSAFCPSCDRPLWEHKRRKVFPEDGPAGSYHYDLECPQ